MKANYDTPKVEVIKFQTEDVIVTSSNELPIVPFPDGE